MNTPSVEVADLLVRSISLFKTVKTPKPKGSITFGDYLKGVRTGQWEKSVGLVREANKDSKADADRMKEKLPAIKPSGTFSGLAEKDMTAHSGILCIDLDDVGLAIPSTRAALMLLPCVLAFHLSPRATGLKVFLAVQATNANEHSACWQAAMVTLGEILPVGVKIDRAPSNVASNCYVSYDHDTWVAATHRVPLLPLHPYLSLIPEGRGEKGVISEESMSDFDVGRIQSSSMSDLGGKLDCASDSPENRPNTSREHARQVRKKAEREITELTPPLKRIFKNYLACKPVNTGWRYAFLLKIIPSLFAVVGDAALVELLRLHHQRQTGTWSTPLAEHMKEVGKMLSDWSLDDYRQKELKEHERQVYDDLSARVREAYRILRDLAKRAETGKPFFMSCAELAARLDCHRDTAHETLRELRAERVITEAEKGELWSKGARPKATSFRWMNRLDPISAKDAIGMRQDDIETIATPDAPGPVMTNASPSPESPLNAKETAPTGLCPACWARRIAAPINGPTCSCNPYVWPS